MKSNHVEDAGLRDARDEDVFRSLSDSENVIPTKNPDFVALVTRQIRRRG
jgi:predicted nuclease of predicted toxin-antitoxin system